MGGVLTRGQDMALPFSGVQNSSLNPTATPSSSSAHRAPAYGLSCLSMGLGVVSNLTGLAVLAASYRRRHGRRRRTKAPFLLLACALLLSDLAGQVIPGALALYLHLEQRRRPPPLPGQRFEPSQPVCQLFGACMVFFGLCPLLLGSAMAMERCLGITTPFLHARLATATHVRLVVLLVGALALSLAALPLLGLGNYVPQHPGTWCFLLVHGGGGGSGGGGQHQRLTPAHATLALTFSSLGVAALLLSVLCNSVSGVTLLRARRRCGGPRSSVTTTTVTITTASVSTAKRHHGPPSTSCSVGVRSLDLEMMAQLVVINVVSCVCWCPFLISISLSVGESLVMGSSPPPPLMLQKQERRLLLSLRLASWNQILDPWVYILLRRAVLRRACCCCCCWLGPRQNHRATLSLHSSSTESHRQEADRN
ncbi:prostaglandin E receptor 1c (subtype EP1) [Engraulis encrasicolus]|uniref:prostaglandin E receptor 1c (subtype EP1) n=1 Tax=Engraulis encrasicolus TaxID=184585 RepID=UPI002FD5DA1E